MEAHASCIAIDIGASGGRVFSCTLDHKVLRLDVLKKFNNSVVRKEGKVLWDLHTLFSEIEGGIALAGESPIRYGSLGIDTWGVDFVLLDSKDALIGDTYSYRDGRTVFSPARLSELVPLKTLYSLTGIQILHFNTVFQLESAFYGQGVNPREVETFLMVPDYFHFLLCGNKANEITNLSTTGLCLAGTDTLSEPILGALDLSVKVFPKAVRPGKRLGLTNKGIPVIVPATHDTASAVAALPVSGEQNILFISSGTWSLIGVETDLPILSDRAYALNYTNERAADGRIRFLKNIMGLWLLQRLREELPGSPSFADLESAAREAAPFASVIDVNDARFLDPLSMTGAIREKCREQGYPIPSTTAALARCVYDSLALSYRKAIREISDITGFRFDRIPIIGGGSKDDLLNQLTSDAAETEVCAGPSDATAIGNCLCQLYGQGAIESLDTGRSLVRSSFPIKYFKPIRSAPEAPK